MRFTKAHILGIAAGVISVLEVVVASYTKFIAANRARGECEGSGLAIQQITAVKSRGARP